MNTADKISSIILLMLIAAATGDILGRVHHQKNYTCHRTDEGTDARPVAELEAATGHSFEMEVTAYCPCEKCCGRWSDGYFANGEEVSFPAIASDSKYPFGTRINVPGYGVAEVKDRGGAIKGDKLDLYFPTHQAALNWGRRVLRCEVVR